MVVNVNNLLPLDFFSHAQNTKRGNTKLLPHFCLYFAWTLCMITIFTCSLTLIFYGMSFGNTTSWEWLVTILISLFKDILVMQPLKILLISLLTSIICKKIVSQHETDFQRDNKTHVVAQVLFSNIVDEEDCPDMNDRSNSPNSNSERNHAPDTPSETEESSLDNLSVIYV